MGHWKTREKSGDFEMGFLYELWVGSAWRYGALTLFSTGGYILHFRTKNEGINSQYIFHKSGIKRRNTLGHQDQYMAQHGRIVKQSYCETV